MEGHSAQKAAPGPASTQECHFMLQSLLRFQNLRLGDPPAFTAPLGEFLTLVSAPVQLAEVQYRQVKGHPA